MLTYVSNLDLSFRKAGELVTYKRGDKIDPKHENYVLTHYAGRVRSSSGGAGVGGGIGLPARPEESSVPHEKPKENLSGLTVEIARQGKKIDKLIDSIETLSQGTVTVTSTVSGVPLDVDAVSAPKPEIKEVILDSVMKTDGIAASGESGDGRSEGEDIETKIDKLRSLKGSKKKRQKKGGE
jgi:hypothetical protein